MHTRKKIFFLSIPIILFCKIQDFLVSLDNCFIQHFSSGNISPEFIGVCLCVRCQSSVTGGLFAQILSINRGGSWLYLKHDNRECISFESWYCVLYIVLTGKGDVEYLMCLPQTSTFSLTNTKVHIYLYITLEVQRISNSRSICSL